MLYSLSLIRRPLVFFVLIGLSACAQLPEHQKPPLANTPHSDSSKLALFSQDMLDGDLQHSKMSLLNEGTDALVARLALINLAEESIDVQYYIWRNDLTGKLLLNQLLKAAKRGVKVRILLDDLNNEKDLEQILIALDSHKNIDIALFNPFAARSWRIEDFLFDPRRMNRRMHNKAFIADGHITIVGGRNIGNEYFHADDANNFDDIDVMSVGPAVPAVQEQFNQYWQSDVVYPLSAFSLNASDENSLDTITKSLTDFLDAHKSSPYREDLHNSTIYKALAEPDFTPASDEAALTLLTFTGQANVIFDDPSKGLGASSHDVNYLVAEMTPYFADASKTIELISPYFVPGDSGVKVLSSYVKSGVSVRVLTNSLSSTDGVLAQSGYARHRKKLLEAGVEVYELITDVKTKASKSLRQSQYAKSGLHSKVYILDRKNIFIGSLNFDPRSVEINTEVGIVYEIPEMAEMIAHEVFDKGITKHAYQLALDDNGDVIWIENKNDEKIIYHTDPKTSIWRRMVENVYSILPIESQL